MKTLFIITTSSGGFYYVLFYGLAFLVSSGIFIYQGFRNHYTQRTWLAITLFAIMCGIIGDKAITVDPHYWIQLFQGGALPASGRSVLGCILGLMAGIFIAQRWLRFGRPVFDHLAYALPVGMAITRLGCLLGGCCYGTPTHLPWGVQYGPGSRAFHAHVVSSYIPPESTLSLPVHPTQVYEILSCLIILFLVWHTRKYWKANGSRLLFAITAYACFRFVLEFMRQSPGDQVTGETLLGLKIVQWMILMAIIILVALLVLRERKPGMKAGTINDIPTASLNREFLLFATVPVFLALASGWLDPFEKLVIWIFMAPLILAFLQRFYSRLTVPELRWKVPVILLVAALGMSQTGLDQQANPAVDKYKGWLSIDAFGGLGSYPENVYDCEGTLTDVLKRDYSTWGAGFTYHYKPREDQHFKYSLNLYSSDDHSDEPDEYDYSATALNTMFSYNWKYLGATFGMNVFFDNAYWIGEVVPVGELWIGRQDIIFAESRFMTDYHYLGPPGLLQVGLGSGFGQYDKSLGRAGISLMTSNFGIFDFRWYAMGGYVGGDFLIKNKATIRGNLFFGKYFGGSLGAQIHLGKNKWTSRK